MSAEENSLLLLDSKLQATAASPKGVGSSEAEAGRGRARFAPRVPETWAEVGLVSSLIDQLILKSLYFKGDLMGGELARFMGLQFSLVEPLLENLKAQQALQIKSSLGYGAISSVFALTEHGRKITRDYLENNQYVGPAPVPLAQYCSAVEGQRMPSGWLTRERLAKAYSHMVVSTAILDQIGPAVSSGKSFLVYGQPGNGKTQLAEALAKIQTSDIYVPYAIECQGNIIQLFDPIYHELAGSAQNSNNPEPPYDGRWARCKRPFIASGGELALSMLDLSYNAISKVYDAPFQLKANNGIYLIDDFGRQKATSSEILNRWIVPMERRIDYLSFNNGGKMTVPFEAFLVFSTNLKPDELGDEAFLRRIQYKMLLRSPDLEEFRTIFDKVLDSKKLPSCDDLLDTFIQRRYLRTRKQFRRCHPRDLISQVVDYITFLRLPYELTDELLDRAFASCFPSSEDFEEPMVGPDRAESSSNSNLN